MKPLEIYRTLLKEFGPQDWWPVKNDFIPPELEICAGAILTQNTNWANVEKALGNLCSGDCTSLTGLREIGTTELERLIRPAGFFKQKSSHLKRFIDLIFEFSSFENFLESVDRKDLLKVKGIGPETADSILLYACNKPHFIIDTYTKRLCSALKLSKKLDYDSLQRYFVQNVNKDVDLYKEFHALIVRLGKECKTEEEIKEFFSK